jgi:hypothetical protein
MVKLVAVIAVMGLLAACGIKPTSSEPTDACAGFSPGPITVTSCPY